MPYQINNITKREIIRGGHIIILDLKSTVGKINLLEELNRRQSGRRNSESKDRAIEMTSCENRQKRRRNKYQSSVGHY